MGLYADASIDLSSAAWIIYHSRRFFPFLNGEPLDFEVQRCTRRCAKTDRELKPGEPYFSVLLAEGADVKRADFAIDAWSGPPENSIGFWKSKMPDPNNQKVEWAPNDVILHYFCELADQADSADTRYVLALLMIRRRILRLESSETEESGQESMVVFCPKNEKEYRVPVTDPSPERISAIQDELANLLFAGADATAMAIPAADTKSPETMSANDAGVEPLADEV